MRATILVVDDEEQVRTFLSKALVEAGGFSVEVAETAEEALQKIQNDVFDLALVDFKLPGMDGLQLITEIVKSKPKILTILLTGHADIDSAVEAMKRGASDYLTKPVDLDEMFARLRKVLKERKRFSSIDDPQQCFFSWEKIKEMKDTQAEFWAGDGLTRLRIVDISERDASVFMITQDGKVTWPLRRQKLEEIHKKIHQREIALLAYEIDKYIPTWGNYVSGLLKYLGCDKGSS
ncbi:MAG: sigma-54-dependent transcriptional regulator [Thermodesulfobacteriota bacterium]